MVISVPKHLFDDSKYHRTYQLQSVFNHTINYIADEWLIALHDDSRDASPMGIIMNRNQTTFEPLSDLIHTIHITNDALYLENIKIPKNKVRLSKHDLLDEIKQSGTLNMTQIKWLNKTIEDELNGHTNQYASYLNILLKEKILTLEMAIKNDSHDLTLAIKHLIGFGEGLTPSGDDVISGLMVGLLFSGHIKMFHKIASIVTSVILMENATSKISKAFLSYATQGFFIEKILVLYSKLCSNVPITDTIKQIGSMGHTSGTDYLIGIVLGTTSGGENYDT